MSPLSSIMVNIMADRKVKMICLSLFIMVVFVILLSALVIQIKGNKEAVIYFKSINEPIKNPFMGFAPIAEYESAVSDNTLVYVELTWREWEPEEGQYNTRGLEELNLLNKWRELGKRVVFRFICDDPTSEMHLDIPDWLYLKTGKDGRSYDISYGKGYAPNYENEIFIKAHEKAINALGTYYGNDDFFCYIEIGSLGHWGEWNINFLEDENIPRIPDALTCQKYIIPYVKSFPYAKLLMRRPFEWVSRLGMGVYNDMTGDEVDTEIWLDWLESGGQYDQPAVFWELVAVPNIWETSPVGGEFNSNMSMDEMLNDNLAATLSLLEKSHMTFIGPKAPIDEANGSHHVDGINSVLHTLGYRYEITKSHVRISEDKKDYQIELSWKNMGVAPLYWDWPVMLYIFDEKDEIVGKQIIEISLPELSGQKTTITYNNVEHASLDNGDYKIGVGILNPATYRPGIRLGMESEMIGDIAIVGWIKK